MAHSLLNTDSSIDALLFGISAIRWHFGEFLRSVSNDLLENVKFHERRHRDSAGVVPRCICIFTAHAF
jgi:hypothetical protein